MSWCFSLRGAASASALVLLGGAEPLSAASFEKVDVPGLLGLASLTSGSLAWGDYDNDNQPDFLVTGQRRAHLDHA